MQICFTGFIISFLGSIPLGTLSITAFNIAANSSLTEAVSFALAVVLVELIVVAIILAYANRINFGRRLVSLTLPFFALVLLYLSISGFMAVGKTGATSMVPLIYPFIKSSFVLGLFLSLSNPLHFPFWLGWNAILKEKGKLSNQPGMYAFYSCGIGLGSLAALMIYIAAGNYLIGGNQQFQAHIALVTSSLYLIFAGYLAFLFIRKYYKVQLQSKSRA